MCTTCLIEDVKARMLSRRALFGGAGAALAATAASTVFAPGALAQGHSRVEDLTHTLVEDFPTYFGPQQFFMEQKFNLADNGFNLFELRLSEHTGTHMDAPLHFSADGQSVAEIPVGNLVTPLCVVDIRAKADADRTLEIEQGSLYPALHRLEHRGLLATEWGVSENNRRAKFYKLTVAGKRRLREQTANWEQLVETITAALRAQHDEA
jgi:kynurenine formamidase